MTDREIDYVTAEWFARELEAQGVDVERLLKGEVRA